MAFADLLWVSGKDNLPGIVGNIYFCPVEDIESLPDLILAGSLQTAAEDIVCKAGKKFHRIYHTADTGRLDTTTVGELDGKSKQNLLTFFYPGDDETLAAQLRLLQNTPGVFICKDTKGNYRLLGVTSFREDSVALSLESPAYVQITNGTTGAAGSDRRGTMFEVIHKAPHRPVFYDGQVPLIPSTGGVSFELLSNVEAIWDASGLRVGEDNEYGEVNADGHLVKLKSIAPGPLGFDLTPSSVGEGIIFDPVEKAIVFNGTAQLLNATKSLYKFFHYRDGGISELKHTIHFVVKVEGENPSSNQLLLSTNRGSISRTGYSLGYWDASNTNAFTRILSNGNSSTPLINQTSNDHFPPNELQVLTFEVDCHYGRYGRTVLSINNNIPAFTAPTSAAVTPSDTMNNADSDVFAIGGTDAGAFPFVGIMKAIVLQSIKDTINAKFRFVDSLMAAKSLNRTKTKIREVAMPQPTETPSYKFTGAMVRNPINGVIVNCAYGGDSHYFDVNKKVIGCLSTDDGISFGQWFDIYKPHEYINRYDAATAYNTDDVVSYRMSDGRGTIYAFKSLIDGNVGNAPDESPGEWEQLTDVFGVMDVSGGFDSNGNCHIFFSTHTKIESSGGVNKFWHAYYPYHATTQFDQEPVVTEITNIPDDGNATQRTIGKMIELDNGDLCIAVYRPQSEGTLGASKIYLLRSSDGGHTWNWVLIETSIGGDGLNESQLYAKGNTLLCYSRREGTGRGWSVYKSTDGGDTWQAEGNFSFGETLTAGHPLRIEQFTLNGTSVLAAYFQPRITSERNYLAFYAKEDDVIADPIDGWNTGTRKQIVPIVSPTGFAVSGYGSFVHFGGLPARGVYWGEVGGIAELPYHTAPVYFDLPTDHEATLIAELGL